MRRQKFEVAGLVAGPMASVLGQELIGLDGVREVEIDVDGTGLATVTVVASRVLEGPEVEAAGDVARRYVPMAS